MPEAAHLRKPGARIPTMALAIASASFGSA